MPHLAPAPELETAIGWLNTDRPLRLDGVLRGRVVVLDFWTYCCINCMHILPDLAYLEHKYRDEPVTFVGVHSAKFANEASRETIRAAMLRYEIKHPVIIDEDMRIWRAYGVRSWPTIVVIDSTGNIVGSVAGEGTREVIDRTVADALNAGRTGGTLASEPLLLRREEGVRATSGLAFPGKVLADAESDRLFIADSNHNRIVVASLPDEDGSARLLCVVGNGCIGRTDGLPENASFNHPQGLACGLGKLFVADTENHLIRAIDLETFEVSTVIGTGAMGQDRAGGAMGTDQEINSPWDLAMEGATLYVAMAGSHQIWRIDLPVGFARAFAGTGRENIVDGPTEKAALAQPSGICIDNGTVYFADSEVSAVRGIDMSAERVFTIVGEGLFSFGDVDGTHPRAKLQHPLGIDSWNGGLLVADTYNHKIKFVHPHDRSVKTLYGDPRPVPESPPLVRESPASTGARIPSRTHVRPVQEPPLVRESLPAPTSTSQEGDIPVSPLVRESLLAPTSTARQADIPVSFFEPGGLSVSGDVLFVADTNNHRIIRIDLNTHEWCEVFVKGLQESPSATPDVPSMMRAKPVSIAADRRIQLELNIALPPGTHFSSDAPWSVQVQCGEEAIVQHTGRADSLPLIVTIPACSVRSGGDWQITASFAYCNESEHSSCIPAELIWSVPVRMDGHNDRFTLNAAIQSPASS